MKSIFENAQNAFIQNSIDSIKEFCAWFGRSIIKGIIDNNKDSLEELYESSMNMRSDIEFDISINRSRDFYMGYVYANEIIARKIVESIEENIEVDQTLDLVVGQHPKLYKIISFLGENGYVQQNEIASHLDITPSYLSNIFNNDSIQRLNIFIVHKVGRNSLYGLNSKGKDYYDKKISNANKRYTVKQIIDILGNIMDYYKDPSVTEDVDTDSLLDKQLVVEINNKLKYFILRQRILSSISRVDERIEHQTRLRTKKYKFIYENENVDTSIPA